MPTNGGDYLLDAFRRDSDELRRTRNVIERVASTFDSLASDGVFPYELERNQRVIPFEGYSPSTNAMILFALTAISGKVARSCTLLPRLASAPFSWSKDASATFVGVWDKLLSETERIVTSYRFKKQEQELSLISWSKSFGWDDPFTLTWILELARSDLGARKPEVVGGAERRARDRVNDALRRPAGSISWVPDSHLPAGLKDELVKKDMVRRWGYKSLDHAFPALRFVHLSEIVDKASSAPAEIAHFMEARLHSQLSRAGIRNGEFDPSELVFSLEGLLRVNLGAVNRALIERVFAVIRETQSHDPYWRPVKPFVTTPQGHVLFPLSVETASSLLRCCTLAKSLDARLFSRNLDLFNVYADWLHARFRTGEAIIKERPVAFAGWHSEHVHQHEGIHLWETSQVLVFLSHYSAMLDDHIAESSLAAAGLKAAMPWKSDQAKWHAEYWKEENRDVGEPLLGLPVGSALRVFELTGKRVVSPRPPPMATSSAEANQGGKAAPQAEAEGDMQAAYWSLLLYGPPGTGKTTFAEELCKALKWPLITVTPSDFIRGGENQVEERAKMIFEVLAAQKDAVVLFDEIDRMLLSRDSGQYGRQGDMFQFMTPSMLTKLRDLRKRERVVFLIGTNYAERIDAAAKRRGRIDAQLLVAPPDLRARAEIVRKLAAKWARRNDAKLPEDAVARCESIAKATPLMVFGELQQLVDDAAMAMPGERDATKFLRVLEELTGEAKAAVSIRSYTSRLKDSEEKKPYEEFLLVVYLVAETGRELSHEERVLVDNAVAELGKELDMPHETRDQLKALIKKELGDDRVAEVVVTNLRGRAA
jgi:hypothetical protein